MPAVMPLISRDVAEWFTAEGYAPTATGHAVEHAWPHDDGYGYLTLRFVDVNAKPPHVMFFAVVLYGAQHERAVQIGTCRSLGEMQRLHRTLAMFGCSR